MDITLYGLELSLKEICMNLNDTVLTTIRRNARWLLRLTALIFALANVNSFAEGEPINPKPLFKLTQGQGTAVCEAYLQRLQVTEFLDNNPTKARLNEPLLKGFADLKPLPLTVEEIQRLFNKIRSFEYYQDQNLLENYNVLHKGEPAVKQQTQSLSEEIKQIMDENQKTPFVRYQILIDMDNDGFPNNTLIQTNKGVYIVDPHLQQIDEDRMKAIFADREILDWPTITQFPPLAYPLNVFGYNGKYYFDGFLNLLLTYKNGIFINPFVPKLLGVFIHERYQTRKVCEYQWVNTKIEKPQPIPDSGYK
jgi:hypothetical protein